MNIARENNVLPIIMSTVTTNNSRSSINSGDIMTHRITAKYRPEIVTHSIKVSRLNWGGFAVLGSEVVEELVITIVKSVHKEIETNYKYH